MWEERHDLLASCIKQSINIYLTLLCLPFIQRGQMKGDKRILNFEYKHIAYVHLKLKVIFK